MKPRHIARILCGSLLALLVGERIGHAAPPLNDYFANRIVLSGTRITVSGSNIEASEEPGEQTQAAVSSLPIQKSVWWTWTAPADGGLVASAMASDFAAVLEVRTGSSVSNLIAVPGGESGSPATGRQPAAMRVSAGVAYQIAVGSWNGDSGGIVLDLAFVPRASNDNFVNRIHLGSGSARAVGSMLGASTEVDEPFPYARPASGSLWWSWTAAKTESVIFQASGVAPSATDYPFAGRFPAFPNSPWLLMGIYVGDSLNQLIEITNTYTGHWISPPLCQVPLEVQAGITYHVWMSGEPGYLEEVELVIAGGALPAVVVTAPESGAELRSGTMLTAAAEAFDPDGTVSKVEFFVSGWSQSVVERNVASTRPFRGTFTNLPPARYGLVARATDNAGLKADSIPIQFDVRPVNDSFASRTAFTGGFVSVAGTLNNASREAGEPAELVRPTVWWLWTAPASGTFTLTAVSEFEYITMDIFTGASLATLAPAPALFHTHERVVLQAEAGVEYAVSVSGDFGDVTLTVAQTEPPTITLLSPTNAMQVFEGSPVTFAADANDPDGSVRQVEFFISSGPSLGVVSNAPFVLTKNLSVGDYWIYVVATDDTGVSTCGGNVGLRIFPVPPSNDAFANRIPFTGSFVTVTGNTASATIETGEMYYSTGSSIWWEWTAPETAVFSITATCEPGYWPWLAVYTGDELAALTMIDYVGFNGWDDSYSTTATVQAVAGQRYSISTGSGGLVRIAVSRTMPPDVHITNPTNNADLVVGETVEIRMAAFDPDGTIGRVELFLDASFYATLTNAPFVISVPFTNASFHWLHARAVDNHGVGTTSEEVHFLVREPGPINDAFTNRIPFTGSFTSVTGTTAHATSEPGEGSWVRDGSAWWEWTAPSSGMYTVTVKSIPGYWPVIAVFTGETLDTLNIITNAAYQGDVPENVVQVVFEAESGVAYPIALSSREQVVLSVARTVPPVVEIVLPAPDSVFQAGDTVTFEAEASDDDGFVQSVEFFLNVNGWPVPIGKVTSAPFVFQTQLDGNTYQQLRARVTDNHGVSTYSAEVRFEARPRPPENDNFANRATLQGWFVVLTGSADGASLEPDEPLPGLGQHSVWWSWVAPASGQVTITCDLFGAILAVFRGTNLAQLDPVASLGSLPQPTSQLGFDARAGENYSIVLRSDSWSTFRLALVLDARELRGPRMMASGTFAFDLYSTIDRNWRFEGTTNFLDWTPLPAGHRVQDRWEFVDPSAPDQQQRYYRAIAVP